jgi:hypothetical protein
VPDGTDHGLEVHVVAPAAGEKGIANIKAKAKVPSTANDTAFRVWRTDFANLVQQYVSMVDIYPLR